MRRILLLPVFLAGCASLGDALQTAEAKCHETPQATAFVTCLNAADEPVWQAQSRADLAAFEAFATARLNLARNRDVGAITPAQYSQGSAQLRAQFDAQRVQAARARQAEAAARNAEQMLDDAGKSRAVGTATYGDMGNGMGGMSNMNGM